MDKRQEGLHKELQNWPGVEYQFDWCRRKHGRLYLYFEGQQRFLTCSKSASDHRTTMNQISNIRRMCREMGAERKGQAA